MSDSNINELRTDIKALTEEVKAIKALLEQLKIIYELDINNSDK